MILLLLLSITTITIRGLLFDEFHFYFGRMMQILWTIKMMLMDD